jgi:CubicO group peptidase (beta-lactamase class C family)
MSPVFVVMQFVRHSFSGTRRSPSVAGIVIASAAFACAPARSIDSPDANARIASIENDIITIDAAGADSGAAQSLISRMAALKVPGLSIAVFDSGRIVWARAYGVVDRTSGEFVDTATLFQAASISKPVTSVGMFRLVEPCRRSLDEDVNAKGHRWAVAEYRCSGGEEVAPG